MHCLCCGICCQQTEMLLSKNDIKRIVSLGFKESQFVRINNAGYVKLRNIQKHCFFYSTETKTCNIYSKRPEGCQIYPILFDDTIGITVDELCTARTTVNYQEQAETGLTLKNLLRKIDREAQKRLKLKSAAKSR